MWESFVMVLVRESTGFEFNIIFVFNSIFEDRLFVATS